MGINTDRPDEPLTIHGNIKLTGHIIQPSDARVKTDIHEVGISLLLWIYVIQSALAVHHGRSWTPILFVNQVAIVSVKSVNHSSNRLPEILSLMNDLTVLLC